MDKFENMLRDIEKEYPNGMNKEQFYKVAHISKAMALYLLKSGLVPCRDTGKKTRRYSIKTKDVITYLRDRAAKPCRFAAPAGWYYEKSGVRRQGDIVKETMLALDDEKIIKLRQFFEKELSEYDDFITAEQVAAFLGCHKSTAVYWCEKRRIKSFKVSAKYLIPKICLVDFLVSPESFCIHQKSLIHRQLLWEFISGMEEGINHFQDS